MWRSNSPPSSPRLSSRGAQRRGDPSDPCLGLPQSVTLLRNDKRVLYGRSAATWPCLLHCHRESSTSAKPLGNGGHELSPRLSSRGAKRRGDPSDPCLGLPQSATLLRNDKSVLYGRSEATWRSILYCHREERSDVALHLIPAPPFPHHRREAPVATTKWSRMEGE